MFVVVAVAITIVVVVVVAIVVVVDADDGGFYIGNISNLSRAWWQLKKNSTVRSQPILASVSFDTFVLIQ